MRSRLFLRAFLTIALGGVLLTGVTYIALVPWLRETVQQQEAHAGRVVLDNVYELAENGHRSLEAWRDSAMAARKRELRHIVQVSVNAIDRLDRAISARDLPPRAARETLLQAVRDFTYGDRNDYVFIADYDSRVIAHPDPELHGTDFSGVKDVRGNLIVPPMVEGARSQGSGFHSYWWRRLEGAAPVQKLTYFRHLPEREWVIATGVYVDDVRTTVQARKEAMIGRLRRHLSEARIGKTGYVYIFDSDMNMIIHPNPNIAGTNFADLENPVSGESIGEELMAAAETPDRRLVYKWDRPGDPGHYVHDKIAWVRHVPGLDWYIASSVYVEEFRQTADTLTRRIVFVGGAALILALLAAYVFLRRLIGPVTRLAETAARVGAGDLNAKTVIQSRDEVGVLAESFNNMVDRLKDQLGTMENRVDERTAELARTVHDLERRNRESAEVNRMGELLQACQSEEEIATVAVRSAKGLFPGDSGRILVLGEDGSLRSAAAWGADPGGPGLESAGACWAVRLGRPHRDSGGVEGRLCSDCNRGTEASLCVPLLAAGSVIGVIALKLPAEAESEEQGDPESRLDARESLVVTMAEHLALAIMNMRLREQLRQESIRDSLTGLYNRRRLEEALQGELARADRHDGRVGVLMVDVDHFKHFNDVYGHDLGDSTLREMGRLLRGTLRREDFACRYGGEEFTVVLPATGADGLAEAGELLRARVAESVGPALEPWVRETVTVSVGGALYPDDGGDMAALLKAADDALYQAKAAGRNRMVRAGG